MTERTIETMTCWQPRHTAPKDRPFLTVDERCVLAVVMWFEYTPDVGEEAWEGFVYADHILADMHAEVSVGRWCDFPEVRV